MPTGTIKLEMAFPVADFAPPRAITFEITQDFDAYPDGEGGIAYSKKGHYGPEVEIKAGPEVLFQTWVSELSGWMRDVVDEAVKNGGWDLDDDEAREELEAAEDDRQFRAEHTAGRI